MTAEQEKKPIPLCDHCTDLGIKDTGNYVFRIKYKTVDMVHEKEKFLCRTHWNISLSLLVVKGTKAEHQFEGVKIIARTDPIKEEGRPGKYRVGGDS